MKTKLATKFICLSGVLLNLQSAYGVVTMTLTESLTGITITGTGTLDTTGMTLVAQNSQFTSVSGADRLIGSGGSPASTPIPVTVMGGLFNVVAMNVGNNTGFPSPQSASGERLSINFSNQRIQVDGSYNVGDTITINNSATYANLSLATLGWAVGSYGASLPNGQINVNIVSTIPEPSSTLFGVAATALLFRRRRS